MYKIIGSDQQVYGPVTAAQIIGWLAEGRVHAFTLCQREGTLEWKPLSSFPELSVPPIAPAEKNGLAVAAIVCGIAANVCCCFGFILAILGIVFAVVALHRLETNPRQGGRNLAIAGLILSIIGLMWHSLVPIVTAWSGNTWVYHRHWHRW